MEVRQHGIACMCCTVLRFACSISAFCNSVLCESSNFSFYNPCRNLSSSISLLVGRPCVCLGSGLLGNDSDLLGLGLGLGSGFLDLGLHPDLLFLDLGLGLGSGILGLGLGFSASCSAALSSLCISCCLVARSLISVLLSLTLSLIV